MSVRVTFQPDDVTIEAEVGEPWLTVADRAGVPIPTGCLMGSCHACEVDLDDDESICACISAVPAGRSAIVVNLYIDPTW
ncbi:MAG: (2Fe-2S)-binding protein [Oscillatoriales cyanobacterium]|jgi:ferredoxin|nr:MAG: (2Fe-2S)-binding protein [Oscillatoriales cyanobacterium]